MARVWTDVPVGSLKTRKEAEREPVVLLSA